MAPGRLNPVQALGRQVVPFLRPQSCCSVDVKSASAMSTVNAIRNPGLRDQESTNFSLEEGGWQVTWSLNGGEKSFVREVLASVKANQSPVEVPKGCFRGLLSPEKGTCIAIGGHRGMGENLWNDDKPLNLPNMWRENTIKSFLKARQHGVTFVEFDVQVTRDGVPVIWHDNLITFGSPTVSPISCRVDELSLEEFQSIGPQPMEKSGQLREFIPLQREFRSRKSGKQVAGGSNLWECFDDDKLPTLEEAFKMLPNDVGLNIEVKMTTPDTIAHSEPAEVNRVVTAVLEIVSHCKQNSGNSSLLLSSFDPDVCTAMQQRQSEVPVMFLTAAGAEFHANPVRTSMSAAIDFACSSGMEGIVVHSTQLRHERSLIPVAIERGLRVMSYGLENDDIDWVQMQSDAGVHAAIVDDVAKILPALIERHIKR